MEWELMDSTAAEHDTTRAVMSPLPHLYWIVPGQHEVLFAIFGKPCHMSCLGTTYTRSPVTFPMLRRP
ncbi:hypothetical protein P692DRAFT_20831264 [Suillus brevipes Sb2]|nr:hypothetical protein P692DRAFT_20831264 [Suillus brevipes Sb2]